MTTTVSRLRTSSWQITHTHTHTVTNDYHCESTTYIFMANHTHTHTHSNQWLRLWVDYVHLHGKSHTHTHTHTHTVTNDYHCESTTYIFVAVCRTQVKRRVAVVVGGTHAGSEVKQHQLERTKHTQSTRPAGLAHHVYTFSKVKFVLFSDITEYVRYWMSNVWSFFNCSHRWPTFFF